MKTLVILSDTHGNLAAVERLMPIFAENDCIIHLGDVTSDMRTVSARFPEKTYLVTGNCDFSSANSELTAEIEGHKLLLCHGHKYGVKSGLAALARRAKELACDIALYGHTHDARIETVDGVLTINPGCMTRYAAEKTYCYLCIHGEKVVPTIVDLG